MPNDEQQSLQAEQILDGKYVLLEELGKGASGTVYKARHILLEQIVAVKIIDPRLSSSENTARRFQNEASILSNFSHPNIVKFISFGILPDGRQYMALEYLEGESLDKYLRRNGAIDQDDAVPIFIDIAEALSYAHEHGIVHRDVKPGNVFLQKPGQRLQAKLIDFGIFKDASSSTPGLTQTGVLIGSANYMSPEQCKGAAADKRSDIYSLACLMYETIVGQPPMQADSELLIMSNHLNLPTTSVPALKTISVELERIIIRCLKKDPAERYQSARELIEALSNCLDAAPKVQKRIARNRQMLALAAALPFIGLLGLFLYYSFFNHSEVKTSISANKDKKLAYHFDRSSPPEVYQERIDWLGQAVKLHSKNERWLSECLMKVAIRRCELLEDEGPVPYGEDVEKVLIQTTSRDENNRNSLGIENIDLGEQIQHLAQFAIVLSVNGKNEQLKAVVAKLSDLFDKYLAGGGKETRWWYRDLSEIEFARGNFRTAINYIGEAERLDNDFYQVLNYNLEAKNYVALGEYDMALSRANRAIELYRKSLAQGDPINVADFMQPCEIVLPVEAHKLRLLLDKYFSREDQLENETYRQSRLMLESLRAKALLLEGQSSAAEKAYRKIMDYCRAKQSIEIDRAFDGVLKALEGQRKPADEELFNYLEERKKAGEKAYLTSLYIQNSVTGFGKQPRKRRLHELVVNAVAREDLEKKYSELIGLLNYQAASTEFTNNANIEGARKYLGEAKRLLRPFSTSTQNDTYFAIYLHEMSYEYTANSKLSVLTETYKHAKELVRDRKDYEFRLDVSYAYYLQRYDPKAAQEMEESLLRRFENRPINHASSYCDCAAHLAELYSTSSLTNAARLLERSLEKMKRYRGKYYYERLVLLNRLLKYYEKLGKTREITAWAKEAQFLREQNDRGLP